MLLLLLYPLRTFQRFCGNWQALPLFTDSFQGVYKDGVVEGKYCYFLAFFFFFFFDHENSPSLNIFTDTSIQFLYSYLWYLLSSL